MTCRRHFAHRRGLTLTDLCIVLVMLMLLLGAMVPALTSRAREQSNRVKCASNLRQIGLAMIMYANAERNGGFPRTYCNLTSSTIISDTTGYGIKNSFAREGEPSPVGENNVTASLFLTLKEQDITSEVFICPSTLAERGFMDSKVEDSSNWREIPHNMSYSVQVMFPSEAAVKAGWKWNNTLSNDFAIASDLNSGDPGLTTISPAASSAQIRKVNSRNHGGNGQNVLFGDGHVEFAASPFCGMTRANGGKDNIFTSGVTVQTIGDMSQDEKDSVMMPIGDAGYTAYSGGGGIHWEMLMLPLGVAGIIIVAGVVVMIVMLVKRRAGTSENSPQP